MPFQQHLDRLDDLAPFLQPPARQFVRLCQARLGRTLLIVSGWRSVQEQRLNYQKGRAMNRETNDWDVIDAALVVTHAPPGLSAHNIVTVAGLPAALAFDCIPLREDGQPDWTVSMKFWHALYPIAWLCGLDPLGDAIGAHLAGDLGHFEEPGWREKVAGLGLVRPVDPLVTV
jgi:hypothetical protein